MLLVTEATTLAEWLERRYLAWQQASGGRRTVGEFAAYLGVKQSRLSNWMAGTRTPKGDAVELLAQKLGGEIYDILGVLPRDKRLRRMVVRWDRLSPEAQERLEALSDELSKELGDDESANPSQLGQNGK